MKLAHNPTMTVAADTVAQHVAQGNIIKPESTEKIGAGKYLPLL
jgi:hypothetical protein